MTSDLAALVIGTVLAVGALAYVLYPLFFEVPRRDVNRHEVPTLADAVTAPAADPVEARVRALRELHPECRTCGVRPERDALYCSTCGAVLAPPSG
jgi:hypothetical protein